MQHGNEATTLFNNTFCNLEIQLSIDKIIPQVFSKKDKNTT